MNVMTCTNTQCCMLLSAYSYSYTTAYTELSALFSLIITGRNSYIVILYDYWCDFIVLILHDYKK